MYHNSLSNDSDPNPKQGGPEFKATSFKSCYVQKQYTFPTNYRPMAPRSNSHNVVWLELDMTPKMTRISSLWQSDWQWPILVPISIIMSSVNRRRQLGVAFIMTNGAPSGGQPLVLKLRPTPCDPGAQPLTLEFWHVHTGSSTRHINLWKMNNSRQL